jgi:hypothetical protein
MNPSFLLPRRPSHRLPAALLGKRGEILLTGCECIHFGSSRALGVHGEPYRPDHDADEASRHILCDLGVILFGELFGLHVVGFRSRRGSWRSRCGRPAVARWRPDVGRVRRTPTEQRPPTSPTHMSPHSTTRRTRQPPIRPAKMFAKCSTRLSRVTQELTPSDCRNMVSVQGSTPAQRPPRPPGLSRNPTPGR